MKIISIILAVTVLVGVVFYTFNSYIYNEKQKESKFTTDFKDAQFLIEGEWRRIGEELQYFGNELIVDLNNDGQDDVVFLVIYSPGGSGTFFYAVASLYTEAGYAGSDGYLLGDRIAPQSTEISQNPSHQNVIVVNYADRAPGDAMTIIPSEGKNAYIKLDTETLSWGVVDSDFVGEADSQKMSLDMKTWTWQRALYNLDNGEIAPKNLEAFTITFANDNSFSVTTDCNSVGGTYSVSNNQLTFSDIFSTLMYCENSQETEFIQLLENTNMYHFTSRGELVLGLKFNRGTVIFR